MKTKLTLLALVAITTLLTSCGSTSGGSATTLTGVKPYPLKVCLVTDNDLNSMGDQQVRVYQGQQIKFCCEPCYTKFLKSPDRYLAKLN